MPTDNKPPTPMTAQLAAMRARLERASSLQDENGPYKPEDGWSDPEAEFVAHAWEDMATLLDAYEALQEQLRQADMTADSLHTQTLADERRLTEQAKLLSAYEELEDLTESLEDELTDAYYRDRDYYA